MSKPSKTLSGAKASIKIGGREIATFDTVTITDKTTGDILFVGDGTGFEPHPPKLPTHSELMAELTEKICTAMHVSPDQMDLSPGSAISTLIETAAGATMDRLGDMIGGLTRALDETDAELRSRINGAFRLYESFGDPKFASESDPEFLDNLRKL